MEMSQINKIVELLLHVRIYYIIASDCGKLSSPKGPSEDSIEVLSNNKCSYQKGICKAVPPIIHA